MKKIESVVIALFFGAIIFFALVPLAQVLDAGAGAIRKTTALAIVGGVLYPYGTAFVISPWGGKILSWVLTGATPVALNLLGVFNLLETGVFLIIGVSLLRKLLK